MFFFYHVEHIIAMAVGKSRLCFGKMAGVKSNARYPHISKFVNSQETATANLEGSGNVSTHNPYPSEFTYRLLEIAIGLWYQSSKDAKIY